MAAEHRSRTFCQRVLGDARLLCWQVSHRQAFALKFLGALESPGICEPSRLFF